MKTKWNIKMETGKIHLTQQIPSLFTYKKVNDAGTVANTFNYCILLTENYTYIKWGEKMLFHF